MLTRSMSRCSTGKRRMSKLSDLSCSKVEGISATQWERFRLRHYHHQLHYDWFSGTVLCTVLQEAPTQCYKIASKIICTMLTALQNAHYVVLLMISKLFMSLRLVLNIFKKITNCLPFYSKNAL